VPVINAQARRLRAVGAQIVLVLAHVGADGVAADGAPLGALGDVARGAQGVDVLVGDHSDVSINAVIGGTLVVENRSKGAEYAVIELQWDATRGALVRASAVQRRPWADEVAPDPTIAEQIEAYRARVRPLFDRPVGAALRVLGRSREAESPLGNFETDALRTAYGTEIAFDVSGALRDDLPSSYEPADHRLRRPGSGYASGPPFDVVRGDLVAVFPFDNVAVTFRITGRALWEALENSVSQGAVEGTRFRNAAGRFLQVSGFAYRFDPRRPPGLRVHDVRLADGTPVGWDGREYTAVTSDFVYQGGDGYTMIGREARGAVTRELIAETVGRAIRERGPADARIEGRIGTVERE
jgi:2',3'-cyclic-nucleotide 2'-phosphodiesterase (5'-nucleotidase family)